MLLEPSSNSLLHNSNEIYFSIIEEVSFEFNQLFEFELNGTK